MSKPQKKYAGEESPDKYKRGSGIPHPVDVHVGKRLRHRRRLAKISQEKLAKALGITFQQLQKYEYGKNRVSASRLYELSLILNVPISFFFDKFKGDIVGTTALATGGLSEAILDDPETMALLHEYYSIDDKSVRKSLMDVMKASNRLAREYSDGNRTETE